MEHLPGAIEVREYLVSNSSAIFRGRAQILKTKLQNLCLFNAKVNCEEASPTVLSLCLNLTHLVFRC